MVLPCYRQGQVPYCRYVVADRDGDVVDHHHDRRKDAPGICRKTHSGVTADVVDKSGKPAPLNTMGFLVIKTPWPAMLRTLYKDDERYRKYWFTIDNLYTAGDLAVKGKDGYIMILGRADDIIIVAGHNIGTAEVESALVSHKAVAEAAVIGKPDPVKGNSIKAFVILRVGFQKSDNLIQILSTMCGQPSADRGAA